MDLSAPHPTDDAVGFPRETPQWGQILALHGRWRGAAPALVVADEAAVSWRDLDAATNRVANGLRALDIAPGERVGVVMENGRAMLEVLFGAMKAGVCTVPINLTVTDEAIATMLADAGVRAVFASASQTDRLAALPPDLVAKIRDGGAAAGWKDYADWLAAQDSREAWVDVPGETPCNIIYSSGTTGVPKGILHSFQGRLDWAYDIALGYGYCVGARTLCTIGLYSNIMWALILGTVLAGGTLFVHRRFDAARALADIVRHRISHIAMVPVQWQRLADAGASRETLASIRSAITVGSPMHVDLKRHLLACMPDAFSELYGLTEGILTVMPPHEMAEHIESVGRPTPGCDILILDDDDRPCPPGVAGEIVSRARYVMPGYWNRPDATAACQWRDPDGCLWLRTGDIGRVDADGYLTIVDRKKDMILSGGQNIYPADLEAVLLGHPGVADGAVIGVPDAQWGEVPLALVIRRPNETADAAAIREWTNARLGKRQRIRHLILVDDLPRNPNGKILKRELRKRFGETFS
ncbi:MAG: class I adenylate-forming enzyme family protein [Rhodothalassiaceae bacterium]